MATPIIAAGVDRTVQRTRHSALSEELVPRFSRWIAPTFGEVARLRPKKTPTTVAGEGDFGTMLDTFAYRLRRAWRVAVLRRSLICGLIAGCIAALAIEWAGGAHWFGPLIAVVTALGVAVWGLGAAPGKDAAARFLDHTLELKEQLSTALELTTAPSARTRSPLSAAVQRRAATTAYAATKEWSVRAVAAGKEWVAAAALLAGVALIAVVPIGENGHGGLAAGPLAEGSTLVSIAPVLPNGPVGVKSFAVQVAVVSAPSTGSTSSSKKDVDVVPKPHGAVLHSGTLGKTSSGGAQPPAPSQKAGAGSKAAAAATATSGQHQVPLIQGSRGFLPTSPSAKGKSNGTFTGASTKSVQSPGTLGSLAGGSSSKSTSAPSANGKGNASQGKASAGKGAGTSPSGKQAAGAAQSGTCTLTYACGKLNKNALTAPGLITGKGQFTGQGGTGGQTAGHAKGTPLTPSKAKTSTPSAQSKQLTITSNYGSNKASGEHAQQVQGHNGAGTSQQTTVTPGANSGQTVDYVAPDANIVQPSQAGIVGRYFVASSAS